MRKRLTAKQAAQHNPTQSLRDDRAFVRRDELIPGSKLSHQQKLERTGAPDLRDGNARVEHLTNGYLRVHPIDADRKHTY